MKIGSKIILFYTSITVGINLFVILIFYVFTSTYIDNLFNANLSDKAYLFAQKHLEKDEMNVNAYRLIEKKYDGLLPQAHGVLLNDSNRAAVKDSLNKYLSFKEQQELYKGFPVSFSKDNICGSALYYPDNQGNFFILVTAQNLYGYKIQEYTLTLSLVLLLVCIAITTLMGKLYSRRIMWPLKHILEKLKNIRGNNIEVRLKEWGNKDELDDLVRTLNEMLDRISEAFKSEKSFVSSASHELSNPLTAIQGECEITLMKERMPMEYKDSLQRIFSESKRMSLLIKQLLFISHHDEELCNQKQSPVLLTPFLNIFARQVERVVFSDFTNGNATILANPYLLKIAIQNILYNAIKYSKKHIDLRLKKSDDHVVIEIEDYGIGIPKEEVPRIFQSFYRASNTREYDGNGIGLALSAKILHIYHAEVLIDSEENVHTKFSIVFNEFDAVSWKQQNPQMNESSDLL